MPGIKLHPKQAEFAEAVFSGKYSYLLYGGAIRGGKSWCVLALLFVLCKIFKGSRWAIVRKDLPTLRRNTIPMFNKLKPGRFVSDINHGTWTAQCANGSEIVFFPESAERDPDLDRWKGSEFNGFILEEMNELREQSFFKAMERAGSWTTAGAQPPPLILGTCNPSQGYVKRLFYDPWKIGKIKPPYYYLPANINDNPSLDKQFLEGLGNLPEAVYRRFVEGDWEGADDPDQLIKFDWLLMARNVEPVKGKRRIGADVAWTGSDDSTLCHIEGNRVYELEYFEKSDPTRLAEIIQARIVERSVDPKLVFVDVVGLGAGTATNLEREGYKVSHIVSGAKAVERKDSLYRFKNLRSQLWWEAREKIKNGEICIDIEDHRLFEDLTAVRYRMSADKVIQVEPKEKIRRELGRSTDAGDAFVYALHEPAYKAEFAFV